jgi:pSer/pThr/pTyr-binding forkhead associated (FHA) protein
MKSTSGADQTKTVLLDEEIITFGRDQTCQVVLAQQAVSRNHARISRDGTLFFLEDLGSSFGTQVNGQKLPKGEKRLLRNGDVIAIAQFDVTFDRVAEASTEDVSGKTSFLSRKVVKDVMKGLAAGGENAYFRVMNGATEGQRIEIADAQEYIFGRDAADADIVLNDDLVSRKHVKVRRDWSGTHVEDLGSRNGIKLNKKRTRKATIKDRDELEIGGVRLLFIDPSEVREDPVVMSASADDDEGTLANKPEDDAPSVEVKQEEEAPPPAEDPPAEEPAAEDQPGDEAQKTEDDPPAEDGAGEESAEGQEEEPPQGDEAEEGPRKLIDFSNKQHLIALGVGGAMVLMGLVLIILLVAGA